METGTNSSRSTELGTSSTMLANAPSSHASRRRRLFTRRNVTLSLLGLVVILFSAIFFPVYFTQHRSHSSSSRASNGTGVATSAAAKTTPGAVWSQSIKFKDLDDFRIEYYSSGESNSKVLTSGLPKSAYKATLPQNRRRRSDGAGKVHRIDVDAIVTKRPNKALRRDEVTSSHPTSSSTATSLRRSSTMLTSSTSSVQPTQIPRQDGSVLEIFYPTNSYTPSELPVGGTQFYALTPFDLSLVQSVTFNYSVFFPAYYDFVMGGKLPGLYGGTEGCGGGNSAKNCWSTRMAWRANGTGELYAYLPQDKQNITALLQVPPYSYVNSDYGISLGRGALNYSRGGWTEVSQTITLSTNASHPNGVFDIKINGTNAIYYDQVYYPSGIKGILFSTFFGGATQDWATPTDQYSYFRGFSIRINSLLPTKKR